MDMICQYFVLCFPENLPTLYYSFSIQTTTDQGGSLPISTVLYDIGRVG